MCAVLVLDEWSRETKTTTTPGLLSAFCSSQKRGARPETLRGLSFRRRSIVCLKTAENSRRKVLSLCACGPLARAFCANAAFRPSKKKKTLSEEDHGREKTTPREKPLSKKRALGYVYIQTFFWCPRGFRRISGGFSSFAGGCVFAGANTTTRITNCLFSQCSTTTAGSAVAAWTDSSVHFSKTRLYDNPPSSPSPRQSFDTLHHHESQSVGLFSSSHTKSTRKRTREATQGSPKLLKRAPYRRRRERKRVPFETQSSRWASSTVTTAPRSSSPTARSSSVHRV